MLAGFGVQALVGERVSVEPQTHVAWGGVSHGGPKLSHDCNPPVFRDTGRVARPPCGRQGAHFTHRRPSGRWPGTTPRTDRAGGTAMGGRPLGRTDSRNSGGHLPPRGSTGPAPDCPLPNRSVVVPSIIARGNPPPPPGRYTQPGRTQSGGPPLHCFRCVPLGLGGYVCGRGGRRRMGSRHLGPQNPETLWGPAGLLQVAIPVGVHCMLDFAHPLGPLPTPHSPSSGTTLRPSAICPASRAVVP